jgi:hypothetical protein
MLTYEFVQIKFIKFGGAEEKWLKKTNDARDEELGWLFKSTFIRSSHSVSSWCEFLPQIGSFSYFTV